MNNNEPSVFVRKLKWSFGIIFKPDLWQQKQSRTLILFRVLAVILGAACLLIDVIVFGFSKDTPKSDVLIFSFELACVVSEIPAMIYMSGAAVFGTTADALLMFGVVITSSVLVHKNCPQMSQQRVLPVIWILRYTFLVVSVELMHRNFKKLPNYEIACRKSARTMLLQAILFSFTILLLEAPGLKTVYDCVFIKPSKCAYTRNECGILEFYHPEFNQGDSCEDGFVQYITTREQARIVRDFIYFHIAYYSMFNKPFLKFNANKNILLNVLHGIILFGLACLVISLTWSHIAPFHFVGWPKLYIFDIAEITIFISGLIILTYSCARNTDDLDTGPMEEYPSIQIGLN